MIVMVLVTTLLTPVLLGWAFARSTLELDVDEDYPEGVRVVLPTGHPAERKVPTAHAS